MSSTSGTLEGLQLQLDRELGNIIRCYTVYQSCIRESLQEKGIPVKDLVSNLLTFSAFNHSEQKRTLLSEHEAELKNTRDLYDVFDLIVKEYTSFMNYELLQFIVENYQLDHGQEELKYPEHLKAYFAKHKISEFIQINPLLEQHSAAATELTLKLDIEHTSRLAKIQDLKKAIAEILGLVPAALRLVDIREGCIVTTFLLPTSVAESVFNKYTILTAKQEEQFRALEVLWLECNNKKFSFAQRNQDTQAMDHLDEM